MIDHDKIMPIIEGYKKYFPEHWKDEKYKWEAVKHFQENWDIASSDFAKMLDNSLAKTENLLASINNFPRRMIVQFAQAAPEEVRGMFADLFDESREVFERIDEFKTRSAALLEKYRSDAAQHYQNENSISIYLWLRYPDKYYIYKFGEIKTVAEELGCDYRFKKGAYAENVRNFYKLYDEICEELKKDTELVALFKSKLTDSCWQDNELKTLTLDIGFYISRYYSRRSSSDNWFGTDFDPGLSVEDWGRLLRDNTIFNENSLEIMKRMKDCGGEATCTQLSIKYGETKNFYNSGSVAIARRVCEATGIAPYVRKDGTTQWWSMLYTGRSSNKDEEGSFVWKLRDELSQALDGFDLSGVELYANKDNSDNAKIPDEPYTKADFLKEVFMTEGEYDRLRALVLRKKNVILQGAPGVGKTFSAKRLAYSIIGERNKSRVCMVQFHQNYSYEDFIMGYRPNDSGGFDLQTGVFYDFCEKCKESTEPYFFIIDEINRGNLSKIFGELLMLIENDKRGEENKINLVYGGKPFYIPENLHIIGMMNTADRSLAMIDYALRRRFSFYTMRPAFDDAQRNGFGEYTKNIGCELYHKVIAKIKDLNAAIRADSVLGRGFEIGHSYFAPVDTSVIDDEWVRGVVEFEIIPLIEEYWFDDDKRVKEWTDTLRFALGESYDR